MSMVVGSSSGTQRTVGTTRSPWVRSGGSRSNWTVVSRERTDRDWTTRRVVGTIGCCHTFQERDEEDEDSASPVGVGGPRRGRPRGETKKESTVYPLHGCSIVPNSLRVECGLTLLG